MKLITSLFVISIIFSDKYTAYKCPTPTSSRSPHFVIPMIKSKFGIMDNYVYISCCVDGYTSVEWTLRPSRNGNWSYIIPSTWSNNTLVEILQMKQENVGIYRCNATDDEGNWVSNTTELGLGCTDVDSSIKIRGDGQKTDFYENRQEQICCTMTTLSNGFALWTKWSFNRRNSDYSWDITRLRDGEYWPLDSKRIYISINKSQESRSWCPSENRMTVYTCVEFNRTLIEDTGVYSCMFGRMQEQNSYNISVSVIKKPDYTMIYIESITPPCTLFIVGFIIIWIFYYDLILLTKKAPSPSNKHNMTDLLIVYDDTDSDCLSIAMNISNYLLKLGVSSFVFDRDKKYGATVHEDYLATIMQCGTVLYLLTPSSIDNGRISFCFRNAKQKKFYIFYPSRSKVLKFFNKKIEEKTIFDKVRVSRDYHIWKESYTKSSFGQRRFFKWILTQLPNRVHGTHRVSSKYSISNHSTEIVNTMPQCSLQYT